MFSVQSLIMSAWNLRKKSGKVGMRTKSWRLKYFFGRIDDKVFIKEDLHDERTYRNAKSL